MRSGPCYVYVIGVAGGPVKVGIAGNPAKRLRQLQHANPAPVAIYHLRKFKNREFAAQVEARAHVALNNVSLHGEWFAASPEEAISAIAAAATWVRNRRANVFDPSARRSVHLRTVR